MKRFRVLNLLLVALVLLAGWRTVDVWRRKPPNLAPTDENRPAQPGDALPALAKKPQLPQMVGVIAEQDLFDISRQEAKPGEAPVAQSTPAPPPTLKLSGVVFVGAKPEAVVTDTSQGNKQIRVQVGEEISGYQVDQINLEEPPTVSLKASSGENVTLTLTLDTSRQASATTFGPGGRPTPRAAVQLGASGRSGMATAPQVSGGSFAPNDARAELERRREDARKRAERARERLKRLRAEAATRQ